MLQGFKNVAVTQYYHCLRLFKWTLRSCEIHCHVVLICTISLVYEMWLPPQITLTEMGTMTRSRECCESMATVADFWLTKMDLIVFVRHLQSTSLICPSNQHQIIHLQFDLAFKKPTLVDLSTFYQSFSTATK